MANPYNFADHRSVYSGSDHYRHNILYSHPTMTELSRGSIRSILSGQIIGPVTVQVNFSLHERPSYEIYSDIVLFRLFRYHRKRHQLPLS